MYIFIYLSNNFVKFDYSDFNSKKRTFFSQIFVLSFKFHLICRYEICIYLLNLEPLFNCYVILKVYGPSRGYILAFTYLLI